MIVDKLLVQDGAGFCSGSDGSGNCAQSESVVTGGIYSRDSRLLESIHLQKARLAQFASE